MQIVPKPDEKRSTIFQQTGPKPFPFIKGVGDTTYVCGLCSFKLLENIQHGQVRKIVFRCPKCGSYNYVP
jgi:DNA-directed RNA polymerase subunit RPC12/RpoP